MKRSRSGSGQGVGARSGAAQGGTTAGTTGTGSALLAQASVLFRHLLADSCVENMENVVAYMQGLLGVDPGDPEHCEDGQTLCEDEAILTRQLKLVPEQADRSYTPPHYLDLQQQWQQSKDATPDWVEIPHAPAANEDVAGSSAAAAAEALHVRCNHQCCRMASVLRADNATFRYCLHQILCVKPHENNRQSPLASAEPVPARYKDWTEPDTHTTAAMQLGKSQFNCLVMSIYWEMLGLVNIYCVMNNGGLFAAVQMTYDISLFNKRLAVIIKDGQRRGVPGLDERGTYISACRLPKNYTQLAEGIRSKQTCCYIDLFNVSKLTRVREALTTDLLTQDAAVYKDVKVSVNLNVDEADATITSPNRDGNKSEIECYQHIKPLVAAMTYITATPGAVLLTEERAGNIITVPLPINLEYIGISKLEPMIDEQPDWEPIGSGTITEDTLSRWFKRYLAPMVADMVADFPSSSEPRVGLLLPSPYTNRRVHEALSAKLLKHVEQHYRHQGVSFVGVANFLLNNGHLSAPEIYHSGWRAVQISKTLLPYVPLLLSGEVCYKQYSQQEQEAYLLQNGCERMTIHSHVQVFAGDKLKRLFPAGGLPLIHQHISAHESFAQEVEHKYIHTLKWHTGEEDFIYFHKTLDARSIITLLEDWFAAIREQNHDMPLLRFTIAGQMARRGLTLKTLQHTGDITDIFFAVSLTSPNRAEIAQQTGRICKAMKPERAATHRCRFWGKREVLQLVTDACQTEADFVEHASSLTQQPVASRLHEKLVTHNGIGTCGRKRLYSTGAITLSHNGLQAASSRQRRVYERPVCITLQVTYRVQSPTTATATPTAAAAGNGHQAPATPAAATTASEHNTEIRGPAAAAISSMRSRGSLPIITIPFERGITTDRLLVRQADGASVTGLSALHWVPESHPVFQHEDVHRNLASLQSAESHRLVASEQRKVRKAVQELVFGCPASLGLFNGLADLTRTEASKCPVAQNFNERGNIFSQHRINFYTAKDSPVLVNGVKAAGAVVISHLFSTSALVNLPSAWYAWYAFTPTGMLKLKICKETGRAKVAQQAAAALGIAGALTAQQQQQQTQQQTEDPQAEGESQSSNQTPPGKAIVRFSHNYLNRITGQPPANEQQHPQQQSTVIWGPTAADAEEGQAEHISITATDQDEAGVEEDAANSCRRPKRAAAVAAAGSMRRHKRGPASLLDTDNESSAADSSDCESEWDEESEPAEDIAYEAELEAECASDLVNVEDDDDQVIVSDGSWDGREDSSELGSLEYDEEDCSDLSDD